MLARNRPARASTSRICESILIADAFKTLTTAAIFLGSACLAY